MPIIEWREYAKISNELTKIKPGIAQLVPICERRGMMAKSIGELVEKTDHLKQQISDSKGKLFELMMRQVREYSNKHSHDLMENVKEQVKVLDELMNPKKPEKPEKKP